MRNPETGNTEKSPRKLKVGTLVRSAAALMLGTTLALSGCSSDGLGRPTTEAKSSGAPARPNTGASVPAHGETQSMPRHGDGNPANDRQAAEAAAWAQLENDDLQKANSELAKIDSQAIFAKARHAVDKALAEDAAWAQFDQDDREQTTSYLNSIQSPDVRIEAAHSVDMATAEDAVWAQFEHDDSKAAQGLLGTITSPDVLQKGQAAVDKAVAEDIAWNHGNPADTSQWSSLKTDAQNAWYKLHTDAQAEWYDAHNEAMSSWYDLNQQAKS